METLGKHATLRVGLLGAGLISAHHLAAWAKLGPARVVAICDPDEARARERARQFGIAAVYRDAAQMVAAGNLDALDIASPREAHAAQVRLGAEGGLAALCQKPLAPSYEEARRLVAEVAGRCRLMVHENWRFRPYYRLVGEWLRAGRIGALRGALMLVRGSGFRPDASGAYPALERQPFMRDLPGLLVSEALIHHLDVLRWLAGPLEVKAAWLARSCPAIRGEDRATIALATVEGAPVVVDADCAAPGYGARAVDALELTGTRGRIEFRDMRLALDAGDAREEVRYDAAESYQASFDACVRHFVERIADGAPFETAPEDNLETLRLVDEVYRIAGPIRSVA